MKKDKGSQFKSTRLNRLPEDLRLELKASRARRGWTQAELGRRIGLPQMHISGIETGKIVPRYDTLLEIVRVLGQDLLMVPKELVPLVQALIRDHRRQDDDSYDDDGDRPLYAIFENEDEDDEEEERRDEI